MLLSGGVSLPFSPEFKSTPQQSSRREHYQGTHIFRNKYQMFCNDLNFLGQLIRQTQLSEYRIERFLRNMLHRLIEVGLDHGILVVRLNSIHHQSHEMASNLLLGEHTAPSHPLLASTPIRRGSQSKRTHGRAVRLSQSCYDDLMHEYANESSSREQRQGTKHEVYKFLDTSNNCFLLILIQGYHSIGVGRTTHPEQWILVKSFIFIQFIDNAIKWLLFQFQAYLRFHLHLNFERCRWRYPVIVTNNPIHETKVLKCELCNCDRIIFRLLFIFQHDPILMTRRLCRIYQMGFTWTWQG